MNTKNTPQDPSNTPDETRNPKRFSGKWSKKPLSDLAIITMGQSPSSIFYNSHGEGLPLIQGNADIEAQRTIERVWTMQGNKHCDLGDLILTVRAPVGAVAVASKNACIGRGVCGLKPFGNSNFLFHALVHAEDRWQALEQGSTFTAANSEQVGQFRLFVPEDENEQRAIAEALSDVDGLLNALETLIAKKRTIKQATMQQLLTGKTRLPGFSGAWETKRLEEVAECLDNVRVPLNEAQRASRQGPYPYCGANGVLDYVNVYVLDDDVILIAEDGGHFDEFLSRPIAYRMRGKIWVNNHAHILKAKSDYDEGFLYFSLVHKNILSYLAGGTRAKLNKFEMYKIEINVPDDNGEQHAIATVLSDMDAEIAALEQRRDKTRAIKQGIMQQLLTGRVRLSESRICTDNTDDAD